ncbi:MAG: large subunit ribosomal protein L31 [Candidatus Berkelbacteria bacterium Licking1014_7]|uniref:50S ribosomal protein L31 n=1 Tax=Candidatus Berkelbacteria bacterium Licking1014_7 TaxID=2017147 RepID=A0A554LI22_9BACT|nr:MAG: large subunit ribosomal protein L31 [Candidatus Berkelbacteria bacterium Licking1014_7]
MSKTKKTKKQNQKTPIKQVKKSAKTATKIPQIKIPFYFDAKIECACGEKYTVGSTVRQTRVEICSACHPYFTGTKRFVDTAGQVDKFKAKLARVEVLRKQRIASKKTKEK